VAIPTTSGTGSEVTPFAVVTDEKTGIKYPLADYALVRARVCVRVRVCACVCVCVLGGGGGDAAAAAAEPCVCACPRVHMQTCPHTHTHHTPHPQPQPQTPNMAICDANLVDGMPRSLTAYGGLDALVHALESYVSVCATDYTKGALPRLLACGCWRAAAGVRQALALRWLACMACMACTPPPTCTDTRSCLSVHAPPASAHPRSSRPVAAGDQAHL
jgi:hypothetical protein